MENGNYRERFDTVISETLAQAVRIIADDPALFFRGSALLLHQKKAAGARKRHEHEGLLVPPVIIASITSRCNLACAGCYMHGRRDAPAPEMTRETLAGVVGEASHLGVSVIVIAGGEPLVRKDEILALAGSHPEILFPVFSNGLLIDAAAAAELAAYKNIVPLISFEGFTHETDARRGSGVYDRLLAVLLRLQEHRVFFGCSVTVSRENFSRVTDEAFVRSLLARGARVFTFVEYVPMEPGTKDLILTPGQKTDLQAACTEFSRKFPALFISFPGDENQYGGCLAAGRGFVHISPSGNLEPCPAAPYADETLARVPLETALKSRLLSRIRERPELLTETAGGCALRANRVVVEKIAYAGTGKKAP
jgi:Predicted Fe-S oxidoreductases